VPVVRQPIIRPTISTYGPEVDNLFFLVLAITMVAMVVVEGLMLIFIVRYRYREGRKPPTSTGMPSSRSFGPWAPRSS